MTKSKSISSRAYIIAGSSSPLASAINETLGGGDSTVFVGRNNPFNFKHWLKAKSVKTTDDADIYTKVIMNQLQQFIADGYTRISIVVVAGVSSNDWVESIATNEYLPSRITEDAIGATEAAGNIDDLSLTYIGSAASYLGGKYPYSVTKASLSGLLHSSNKRSPSFVRSNLVIPGAFEGGMIADWDSNKRDKVSSNTTINRIASSKEIADAIIFTSTNEYIADSVLNMSAGQVTIE